MEVTLVVRDMMKSKKIVGKGNIFGANISENMVSGG